MTPVVNALLVAMSSSVGVSIVAKATVVVGLGLLGARLARGSRAAVRHALLAATFAALLLLPIASIVAPPLRISVRAAAQERIMPAFAEMTLATPPVAPAHPRLGVTSVVPGSVELSLSALLLTGWIAGTAIFLLPVVTGLWQVRSLFRSALPWRHGQLIVERLALDPGIHRRVEVLLHEGLYGPMTCGVVHPAIVLSKDAQTWNEEDLTRAIVHELEHVRRGDWLSHCFARTVCAVYWFHPLVWIAWRQLALEAERSCDDAVLGHSEATAYADQLVGLARRLLVAARLPLPAMASHADLATRVGAVLDSRQHRGRAGRFFVVLTCAVAAVLVLTMSPLRMVAAPQSSGADVRTAAPPQFEVVSVRPSRAAGWQYTIKPSAGGFAAKNIPLSYLIMWAFKINDYQLAGAPKLASDRYDIAAKPGAVTEGDMRLMLLGLLQDRFKLKVHRERREGLQYVLTIAKGGSKLKEPKEASCPAESGPTESGPTAPPCGRLSWSSRSLAGRTAPMQMLVFVLSQSLGATVVDKTGLKGPFDMTLRWTPDAGSAHAPADDAPPSLFAAVQEQMGLKLQPRKGLTEVIVVDHLERPTEN